MKILEEALQKNSKVRISLEQLNEYSKALDKIYILWSHTSTTKKIREDWDVPEFTAIHWDGEIMPSFTSKYTSVDWLPMLISGNDNFKLLGIPIISKSGSDA